MLLATVDIVIKWIPDLKLYKNTRELSMDIALVSLILTLNMYLPSQKSNLKLSVLEHPKMKADAKVSFQTFF